MMTAVRTSILVATGITLLSVAPAMSQGKGGPKDTRSSGRAYYLTVTNHEGAEARFACAPGFHMASVYELLDASNLSYDPILGAGRDDSGAGPPAGMIGWVRTGWNASGSGSAGTANCRAYTSSLASDSGTGLTLRFDLQNENLNTLVRPWFAVTATCELARPVWCVQD